PVSPQAQRPRPSPPASQTMPPAAIRPSAADPPGPCIPTPVRSADTYAHVFPSASLVHAHAAAGPNVSPAVSRAPTRSPARSVTRWTVDSLTRSPLTRGNVFPTPSAKLP